MPSSSIVVVFSIRSQFGIVLLFWASVFYDLSVLVFQLVRPIPSIVVAFPRKRALLCETLVFPVLYGQNRLHVLHETAANGYPSFFGAQGCKLMPWRAFVVVRFLSVADGVSWNLRIRVTVPVVVGLAPDCTVIF